LREFINRMSAMALFNAGTCVFLEVWTGNKRSLFCPFFVSLVNIAEKRVKKCRLMHVAPSGSHGKQPGRLHVRQASRA
jgi:hypothetical protein